MIRYMFSDPEQPSKLRGNVITTVTYLQNKLQENPLENPFQLWHSRVPNTEPIRFFGSKAEKNLTGSSKAKWLKLRHQTNVQYLIASAEEN